MKHRLLRHFGLPENSWRYALADDYSMTSHYYLAGVHFDNHWLSIHDRNVRIKAGYAWDGCSPCMSILGLFYVGPPDGAEHLGNPATYHASLVHDALCQFRTQVPVSKATAVGLFRELLDKARFPLAWAYAAAVDRYGPQAWLLPSSDQDRRLATRRHRIPPGSGS
jgi:hypothetical protein